MKALERSGLATLALLALAARSSAGSDETITANLTLGSTANQLATNVGAAWSQMLSEFTCFVMANELNVTNKTGECTPATTLHTYSIAGGTLNQNHTFKLRLQCASPVVASVEFDGAGFTVLVPGPNVFVAGADTVTIDYATVLTTVYDIPLSDTQEVPPTGTGGSGSAVVILDPATGDVTVVGSYASLGSNQTLAHIHGSAPAGMNAGIIVTLTGTGGTSGTFSGSGTLTAGQATAMQGGLHYINVHTMSFGAGEIRGQICESGASVFRNSGANPASYTCAPLIFGGTLSATVDLSTTGHNFAVLFGFDSMVNVGLAGGQRLLCLDLGGSGEIFDGDGLGPIAGPSAVFTAPVPFDLSLCNFSFSSQAIHLGGVMPFMLSNAQDLTLGF